MEIDAREANEPEDFTKDAYNEVERLNILNEFIEENPEYVEDYEVEYDEEKLQEQIEIVEAQLYADSFLPVDTVYDFFEQKELNYYEEEVIKTNMDEIK